MLDISYNLWYGACIAANWPWSLYNGFLRTAYRYVAKIKKTSQRCLAARLVKLF